MSEHVIVRGGAERRELGDRGDSTSQAGPQPEGVGPQSRRDSETFSPNPSRPRMSEGNQQGSGGYGRESSGSSETAQASPRPEGVETLIHGPAAAAVDSNPSRSPVYSPTQTARWDECPAKRALYRLGWRPRRFGRKEIGGILGTSFAAGVAAANHVRKAGGSPSPWVSINVALSIMRQQLWALEDVGRVVSPYDEATLTALPGRVEKAVSRYLAADPLPSHGTILDVELTLPEGGNCRLDVGLEDADGPAVWDYKVRTTLPSKYLDREKAKFRDSSQMFHYSFFYGRHLERLVRRYYICLVGLDPTFQIHVIPFQIHEDALAAWEHSAVQIWRDIADEDAGVRPVRRATVHEDGFGDCEYRRACFECSALWAPDYPALMAQDYVQVERDPAREP